MISNLRLKELDDLFLSGTIVHNTQKSSWYTDHEMYSLQLKDFKTGRKRDRKF